MKNTTTTKPATKAATKPVSKAATKPVGAFASVHDALKACGIAQRINIAGHIAQGRIDKAGHVTKAGKAYFANRLQDEQKTLAGFMAKAKTDGFKSNGYVFAPVANAPVSHAPVNPGSYSASIIRAWFSILVATVK